MLPSGFSTSTQAARSEYNSPKRRSKQQTSRVDATHPQTGVGGGGTVTSLPFTTELTIGTCTVDNLNGVYFPSGDQYGIFPFTVTGTVSHQFFRKTTVTFDFVAMRLVIDTNPKS